MCVCVEGRYIGFINLFGVSNTYFFPVYAELTDIVVDISVRHSLRPKGSNSIRESRSASGLVFRNWPAQLEVEP